MMKKLGLTLLLGGTVLGLAGCHTQNTSQTSSSQESTVQANSNQASSDQAAQKAVTWQFNTFKVTQLKAEVDHDEANEVSVELAWQNIADQAKSFADQAVITVSQNGEQLAVLERDDDLSEAIQPQATEDLETTFRLKNSHQPLTVKVSTRSAPQKTQQTQLKLAPTTDD